MGIRRDLGISKKKVVKIQGSRTIEPEKEVVIIDLEDYIAFQLLLNNMGKDKDERLEVWDYLLNNERENQPIAEVFYKLGLKSLIKEHKAKLLQKI